MTNPIGFAVVVADQLDKTRSISFQFNLALGASDEEINVAVDQLARVLDRQRAKQQIYEVEQFLKAQHTMVKTIEDDIRDGQERLVMLRQPDASRRAPPNEIKTLSDNLERQGTSLKALRDKIEAGEAELEILRKKAA